ncbi:coiled-coil domain-containing protein 166 [Lepisosteus oculatus]|uniref:coiled-coil domain-containing protein 166 n=1 Tax=Lepisosteus oculatus TaxID=7918 RepID=UPI0035F51E32
MPKKKADSGPKLKTSEGDGADEAQRPATDKEVLLQKEYEQLTEALNSLRRNVEHLRRENEYLQQEAHQTRMESQEYMSYMSKRTQKRQNAIISLSDQNQVELEKLRRQREELLDTHKGQSTELKRQILEKENELSVLNLEISDMQEYKSLQQQQLGRIQELEQEVLTMRARHSESLQHLKAGFLGNKVQYESQARHEVQALAVAANREASRCLAAHTQQVAQENRQLRGELLQLIQRARDLRLHQGRLQEQGQQLLRERQYVQDLRRLRGPAHCHAGTGEGSTQHT